MCYNTVTMRKDIKNNKKPNNDLPVVIFMGIQGSGKGTQAKLLAEKYGFAHVETGQLWRNAAKRKDNMGKIARRILSAGKLAPSWETQNLVNQALVAAKKQPIVIDGSPRQVVEAKVLEKNLAKISRDISVIMLIGITDKEGLKRLLLRGRDDDTPELIRRRFAWSKDKIARVLKYLSKRHLTIKINGEQSVAKVHKDILKELQKRGIIKR